MIGIVVKWERSGRGFGFIRAAVGPDFLFLPSGLLTPVRTGDQVEFLVADNPDGDGVIAVDIAVRGTVPAAATRVFVGNVPSVPVPLLRGSLEEIGPGLNIIRKPEWDYAYVDFVNASDVQRALSGAARPVVIEGQELRFKACRAEGSRGADKLVSK